VHYQAYSYNPIDTCPKLLFFTGEVVFNQETKFSLYSFVSVAVI